MNNIQLGSNHIWLPYTQMQDHLPQREIESAKGSELFLKDGRTLIDGISSWWSAAHGYSHPHLIEELKKQTDQLPHIMLAGFANEQTYKLAHRLCNFARMDKVFFSDSGSVAVEVAMKIAWQFHMNVGQKEKTKFVSFKNSYHGDTTGAMSLADLSCGMHEKFKNALSENFSVDLPSNKDELAAFDSFIATNRHILAGIFIEPLVQCAGGMKFSSPDILKGIFEIAQKHKVLFIADECAVGFYRTGKKFACDHANITPDILILAKALTGGTVSLAATLVKDDIFQAFLGESLDLALMHGPTFMGNPLACAAANASLDLFEEIDYADAVAKMETQLKEGLKPCRGLDGVKDVRVLGALGVVEIEGDWQKMMDLRTAFVDLGIFLRPFANCIYVMPALNIKEAQLRTILEGIIKVLS